MKTTTALFANRREADAAISEMISRSYEPRRVRLQLAGDLKEGKIRRRVDTLEVRPNSSRLAGWGALFGALFVCIGGLSVAGFGGIEAVANVTPATLFGALGVGAGLGGVIGAYAGLANWTVEATLDPSETGPILIRYNGPDHRADQAAMLLKDAGALDILAA